MTASPYRTCKKCMCQCSRLFRFILKTYWITHGGTAIPSSNKENSAVLLGFLGKCGRWEVYDHPLLMQTMLQTSPDKRKILRQRILILLPTQELINRGISDRKGFPESYDMEALVLTGSRLRNPSVDAPVARIILTQGYCARKCRRLSRPISWLSWGDTVLQLPSNREIYSDFFDWSIFVDADNVDWAMVLERLNYWWTVKSQPITITITWLGSCRRDCDGERCVAED